MVMLTSTMARFQVRVLDVGQAVIHDELSLGMMLEVPAGQNSAELLAALGEALDEDLRFAHVSGVDYQQWVAQQGKTRHIVTLLAAGVSAEQLAAVVEIVERHGLSIEAIRRLSGRVRINLEDPGLSRDPGLMQDPGLRQDPGRASVELSLRGEPDHPATLKADLLEAAGRLTFDFSVQQDTVYRRNRRLVAFDMDSTLIDAEVIDELAGVHGVGDEVSAITAQTMQGEIDFQESFRRRVALLKGLPEAALRSVAERVELTEGAHRLTAALKHFGYTTAIISGGFRFVGERLLDELGIDLLFANELEVVDGYVTGVVRGEVIDAEGKAQRLREICSTQGIALAQTIAIGDGANDLPMLNAAGMGVAFHAKPLVRESASHAISNFGLDSVLYLMGFSDRDIEEIEQ
jgi:phosphoserine phosphatase